MELRPLTLVASIYVHHPDLEERYEMDKGSAYVPGSRMRAMPLTKTMFAKLRSIPMQKTETCGEGIVGCVTRIALLVAHKIEHLRDVTGLDARRA